MRGYADISGDKIVGFGFLLLLLSEGWSHFGIKIYVAVLGQSHESEVYLVFEDPENIKYSHQFKIKMNTAFCNSHCQGL